MRNELARDLGLNAASSTGPLLDCLLQQQRGATTVTSSQPLSTASLFTAAPRQHQETSESTALPTQTQPIASASLATALNTSTANTTSTNDPSQLFAYPTLDKLGTEAGGTSDFSPFDQFSKTGPLSKLPRNTTESNSLPVQEHKDGFGHGGFVSGLVGDRTDGDLQGQAVLSGLPSSEKVETLSSGGKDHMNGKSGAACMGELNDFFSKQLNTTEQRYLTQVSLL